MSIPRTALALLLTAALGAAAAPSPADAAPETVIQDDSLMLHASDDAIRTGLDHMRELGFDRVRLTADWSVIAPQPWSLQRPDFDATDPAAYPKDAWNGLDRAVRMATDAGLKPMIDIGFWAPVWATTDTPFSHRPKTHVDPADFAQFATAVARRYSGGWAPPTAQPAAAAAQPAQPPDLLAALLGRKPSPEPPPPPAPVGVPLPAVDLFTLWNEPNHPGFLQPQWSREGGAWIASSADVYRAMVRAAYPAVKAAAPGARVLVGGTASFGSNTPGRRGVPPLAFLRRLACVDDRLQPITTGACADFQPIPGDGWAHHPYSLHTTPDVDSRNRDQLPVAATSRLTWTLRTLVAKGRLAPGLADVYMTEYGYETHESDPRAPWSEAQQPLLLAWAESIATSDPAVRMWPQFQLYDRPEIADDPAHRYSDWQTGLYRVDGTPKPAASEWSRPVFARCLPGRRGLVEVWGALRGVRSVAAQVRVRRAGSAWRAVASAASSGGPVRRDVRASRRARISLTWTTPRGPVSSAVVRPEGCGGA